MPFFVGIWSAMFCRSKWEDFYFWANDSTLISLPLTFPQFCKDGRQKPRRLNKTRACLWLGQFWCLRDFNPNVTPKPGPPRWFLPCAKPSQSSRPLQKCRCFWWCVFPGMAIDLLRVYLAGIGTGTDIKSIWVCDFSISKLWRVLYHAPNLRVSWSPYVLFSRIQSHHALHERTKESMFVDVCCTNTAKWNGPAIDTTDSCKYICFDASKDLPEINNRKHPC